MDPTQPSHAADAPAVTAYLLRPEGRIAYDLAGEDGPLVVRLPGTAELRSSHRHTRPALVQAGYQVATMDLRGHGDSDTSFAAYDDVAAGTDALALIQHLGHPAVLIGNSMRRRRRRVGGSREAAPGRRARPHRAVRPQRADEPPARAGLPPGDERPLGPTGLGLAPPEAVTGTTPGRLPAAPGCHLAEPGPTRPLGSLHSDDADEPRTRRGPARRSPHAHPGGHQLGTRDPDFPDPAAEAHHIAGRLGGEVLLVDGAGHYPHADNPDAVNPTLMAFLDKATQREHRPTRPRGQSHA